MTDRKCPVDAKLVWVDDTEDNAKRCACPSCPTYDDCMKGRNEELYCARGPSGCSFRRLGCVCGECDVAIEHGLSSNYYCDGGPAKF